MDFGLEFIKKLKPCKWRYKKPLDDGVEHFGFIAQEVDALAPKEKYAFTLTMPDEDKTYMVRYHEFIGPLVKAVQELSEKVEELETQIKGDL